MIRKQGVNIVPSADIVLSPGDGLLLVAERQDALSEAERV